MNKKTQASKQQTAVGCVILLVVLVIVAIIIVMVAEEDVPEVEDEAAWYELFDSCAYEIAHDEMGTKLGEKRDPDTCQGWADATMDNHLGDVRDCHQNYLDQYYIYVDDAGSHIENFEACIIGRGISYP